MDEFSIDPTLGFGAELVVLGRDMLSPFLAVAEMDNVVIFVEESESGREIRDEHKIAKDVDVGRKDERIIHRFEMFAIEVEPLQAAVASVGHAEGGFFSAAIVDPESVREIEFTVLLSGLANGRKVAALGIITVNAVGAVSIGEIKASVGRVECDVGGHETLASPYLGSGKVFSFFVATRSHGRALIPDRFSGQGELGEGFHLLVSGDVEEFLVSFGMDFDAVSAALELASERANEAAFGIEDKDTRVIFLIREAFVHYVKVLIFVDGDIVRGLPGEPVREQGPVVDDFVLMLSFAQNDGPVGLLRSENVGKGEGRAGEIFGLIEKVASG